MKDVIYVVCGCVDREDHTDIKAFACEDKAKELLAEIEDYEKTETKYSAWIGERSNWLAGHPIFPEYRPFDCYEITEVPFDGGGKDG